MSIVLALGAAASCSAGAYLLLVPSKSPPSKHATLPQHFLTGAVRKAKAYPLTAPLMRFFQVQQELNRRARLQSVCLQEIPLVLDVVTLGLKAGLSFDAALELYCTRFNTELAHELSQALISWRMGITSRAAALQELAQRLQLSTLRHFADAVQEALMFGSPLAAVLSDQAQSIRADQKARIEEEIERVPVKMLIPLGTLIVPAMLLAILGPLISSAFTSTWLERTTMFTQSLFPRLASEIRRITASRRGQGTTEYAILVGVLVVIAIVAILAFKDKVSEVWNSISEGINSL